SPITRELKKQRGGEYADPIRCALLSEAESLMQSEGPAMTNRLRGQNALAACHSLEGVLQRKRKDASLVELLPMIAWRIRAANCMTGEGQPAYSSASREAILAVPALVSRLEKTIHDPEGNPSDELRLIRSCRLDILVLDSFELEMSRWASMRDTTPED